MTPIFNELWNIYTSSGYDCFARTINDIREKFEMRPIYDEKKVWALFVSKISHYSGKQYDEKLIQKKEAENGMTIAVAQREWKVSFDEK